MNQLSWSYYIPAVAVMALVTYLIRMIPLTFFRKPIKSRFVKSFLFYVPYAVLTAMTIPDVLYSTGFTGSGDWRPFICAAFGLMVGTIFAWKKCSLLTVAIVCVVAVAAAQGVMLLS